MVTVSVVISLFNDDSFVAVPMITVADDVAVAIPVTISVSLTNRYANTASTNAHLFRSSRLNWSRVSEQQFRVDKWSLCRG